MLYNLKGRGFRLNIDAWNICSGDGVDPRRILDSGILKKGIKKERKKMQRVSNSGIAAKKTVDATLSRRMLQVNPG